jgi:signal transduction histidine kinase
MRWAQIRDWLLPGSAEQDEGFRLEMLSVSFQGARAVSAVEAAVALGAIAGVMPRQTALSLLVLGAATFGLASRSGSYPYNRLLAGVSAGTAAVLAERSMLAGAAADYALGTATFLLLVTVTAVPMQPLQCLLMGVLLVGAGLECGHLLFFTMLTLAAVWIGGTQYAHRRVQYASYVDALHNSSELREYQSQAMRAESSTTMVRLTAALAHELSSPIGALTSGIETLIAVCARQAQTPPEGQPRLLGLQEDLRRSLKDSLERLCKTVHRIQRLTNLDEAVTQQANLNELVNEAVSLMRQQGPAGTRFDLDLHPVRNVTCRPQRLMSVLCSLLTNSIQAVTVEGRIAISTQQRESVLEVRIEDNGRGIPADQLARIFDPRFEVSNGRVSTGNWSLFMSRQYMKEHGGDIRIQSLEGKGTTVCLTLPAAS